VRVSDLRAFVVSWVVPGVLEIRESVVDSLGSIVEILCDAVTTKELVTVRVLDEEISMCDIVA
jgi:hypothetical protein